MERTRAQLEAVRAIGRIEGGGPWVGFGYRSGSPRMVVGDEGWTRDGVADPDLALALAIAHYAEAFSDAPPDLEATQSDLSKLVRHLTAIEPEASRRALLAEAMDAIDDGLAGDAVAARLEAARSARGVAADPVELVARRAREIAEGS